MVKAQSEKEEQTLKKLDLIAATLLAQSGLTRSQIAQIIGVSEKTIERMFSGNLNKISRSREAKSG